MLKAHLWQHASLVYHHPLPCQLGPAELPKLWKCEDAVGDTAMSDLDGI